LIFCVCSAKIVPVIGSSGKDVQPGHRRVNWEYGRLLDPFADAERIRDHLLLQAK